MRKPEKRLGFNGAEEIKKEPFFASVNWQKLANRAIKPPFHPDVVRWGTWCLRMGARDRTGP